MLQPKRTKFRKVHKGRNTGLAHRGVRPTVRGMAMNPIDHPHGGGEGRNKGIQPVSPWGQKAKGYKTRTNKRTTKMIIRDRRVK